VSYTRNELKAAGAALAKALPGLNIHAAILWARAEQGANHNILGVTYYVDGRQRLNTYPDFDTGARAAAAIILASPQYAGIRKALTRNDIHDQLRAIAMSPWHCGAGGLKKNGGIDPYYAKLFTEWKYNVYSARAAFEATRTSEVVT